MNLPLKRYRTEKLDWWFVIHLPPRRPSPSTSLRQDVFVPEQFRDFVNSMTRSMTETLSDKQLWNKFPKERRGGRLWFVAAAIAGDLTPQQLKAIDDHVAKRLPDLLTGSKLRPDHDVNTEDGFGWKIHIAEDETAPQPTTIAIRPETSESVSKTSASNLWTAETTDGILDATFETVPDYVPTAGEEDDSSGDLDGSQEHEFNSAVEAMRNDSELVSLVAQLANDPELRQLSSELGTNAELRKLNQNVIELQKIAKVEQSRPLDALHRVEHILKTIRVEIGGILSRIIGQWSGRRWDLEESKQIASTANSIVRTMGLGFSAEDIDGSTTAATLQCVATGKDSAPTFRLVIGKNPQKNRIRHSSRDFPTSHLLLVERFERSN